MWREAYHPCTDPNIRRDDDKVWFDEEGIMWYRKGRYWVVTGRSRDNVTEVRIFTYNDTGLRKKKVETHHHYNSIKPPNVENFVNQSPGQKVLEIGWQKHGENWRNTMVLQVSTPTTRSIDIGSRIVGGLDDESTNEVIRRTKEFIGVYCDH